MSRIRGAGSLRLGSIQSSLQVRLGGYLVPQCQVQEERVRTPGQRVWNLRIQPSRPPNERPGHRMTRICLRCSAEKPASDYSGGHRKCKPCRAEQARKLRKPMNKMTDKNTRRTKDGYASAPKPANEWAEAVHAQYVKHLAYARKCEDPTKSRFNYDQGASKADLRKQIDRLASWVEIANRDKKYSPGHFERMITDLGYLIPSPRGTSNDGPELALDCSTFRPRSPRTAVSITRRETPYIPRWRSRPVVEAGRSLRRIRRTPEVLGAIL